MVADHNLKYIISNQTPGLLHPIKDTLYFDYEKLYISHKNF